MALGNKVYTTRGFLTAEEQKEVFINQFEFSGFENSLWALLPAAVPDRREWHNVHVSVELDNVTSIKYGRVAVSRSIRMSLMGARFFDRVEAAGITLSFRHLAGELNVWADRLSRQPCTHADWKLDGYLFRWIRKLLDATPRVDLFASSHNTQLRKFYSYNHDHRAVGADAFLHQWTDLGTTYAYPPPILLGRVLQKLRGDFCRRSIVVVPVWVAQTWFPTLLGMLRAPPLLLPNKHWIVTNQLGDHCWPERRPLCACDLSGDLELAKASRRRCFGNVGRIRRADVRTSVMRLL